MKPFLAIGLLIVFGSMIPWAVARADDAVSDESVPDEELIIANAEKYADAYNSKDAKALAALWSPDAVYEEPEGGKILKGRDAIEQQYTSVFSAAESKRLEIDMQSIRFISPNVAVEEGVARVLSAEGEVTESAYSAVHVKRDGTWLIDHVTEEDLPVMPPAYEQLKALEWMIGTWVDQDDHLRVETTVRWTANNTFLIRAFTVIVDEQTEMGGTQIVGWDPSEQQIRSWTFDSDGGFAHGTWQPKDDGWRVDAVSVLPDGRKASSTNIITIVDEDSFKWQSVGREVDGEIQPNIDEVLIVRQR